MTEADIRAAARGALSGLAGEAPELERSEAFPWTAVQRLRALGLFGVPFPTDLGGLGAGWAAAAALIEEASRVHAAIGAVLDIQLCLVAAPVAHFASPGQEEVVRSMVTGEALGAFALTEREAGSDPRGMQSTARRSAGGYRIDGAKIFISDAAVAQQLLVFAKLEGRPTAFLVRRDLPGVAVGPPLRKMGMRSVGTHEVRFEGVEVEPTARLGSEGEGMRVATYALVRGRIGVGAQAIGIGRAAFAKARSHVLARKQFGQALAGFQGVQMMLAEMEIRLRAAELLIEDAARRLDAGEDVRAASALAKVAASEAAVYAADRALQLLGGYGYLEEYEVERYLREARLTEIYEGTSEINRLIVAREILRQAAGEGGGRDAHAADAG